MAKMKQRRLAAILAMVFCVATPLVAQTSAFDLAVAGTSGSVDVVLGVEPGDQMLEALLKSLSASSVYQVRFSAAEYAPWSIKAMGMVEDYISENGLDWYVCHGWWLSPDTDDVAALLKDQFGGSLIFFDEGPTSDYLDNPNADMAKGMETDAVFGGVLNGSANRVRDPALYYEALTAIWTQIVPVRELDAERQSRGGWVDGC